MTAMPPIETRGARVVSPPSRERRQTRGVAAGAQGRAAEARAAARYERAGWRVVARNWRAERWLGGGELDFVARRDGLVAVVEVKRRRSLAEAATALSPAQRRRIEISALRWLEVSGAGDCDLRIDVAAVDREGRMEIFENVTMD